MAFEYLTNTPLEQAKSEYFEKLRELGMSPKAFSVFRHG